MTAGSGLPDQPDDEPPHPPDAGKSPNVITWLLSHPNWSGIAVLVAVTALILPILITNEEERTTATATCGAVTGDGNSIDCSRIENLPSPTSLAEVGIEIAWGGGNTWQFHGPSDSLPNPPDYPLEDETGHCQNWGEFFASDDRFYAEHPGILLFLMAGIYDQVAVTNLEARVFSTKALASDPTDRTVILCQYGAGLNTGYLLTVDTRTGKTFVTENDYLSAVDTSRMTPLEMPPRIDLHSRFDRIRNDPH